MANITITDFDDLDDSLNFANDLRQLKTAEEVAAGVGLANTYPLNPRHPQSSMNTDGVVVCLHDATNKKIVHSAGNACAITLVTDENVIEADSSNQGGNSHFRMCQSWVAGAAVLGILTPRSISSGVSTYALSNTDYDESIGRNANCDTSNLLRYSQPTSEATSADTITFGDRNVYNMTAGKVVNFWVNAGAKVSFWCGSGETYADEVRIDVNTSASASSPVYDISGQTGRFEVEIPDTAVDGYISISNATVNKCYVMGVNITPLNEADPLENYDSFAAWYNIDYTDYGTAYWIGRSDGANDFAIRAAGTGRKTFGSTHGGHSNEVVTLNGLSLDSYTEGEFTTSKVFTFASTSDLTDGTVTATCTQKNTFSQGKVRTETTIDFGESIAIKNLYTGMTCTNERFTHVLSPDFFDMTTTLQGDEHLLGATSECVQYDPLTGHSVETNATWFNHSATTRGGAYILNRESYGDYKFYLDSMAESSEESTGFTAITYRTFKA